MLVGHGSQSAAKDLLEKMGAIWEREHKEGKALSDRNEANFIELQQEVRAAMFELGKWPSERTSPTKHEARPLFPPQPLPVVETPAPPVNSNPFAVPPPFLGPPKGEVLKMVEKGWEERSEAIVEKYKKLFKQNCNEYTCRHTFRSAAINEVMSTGKYGLQLVRSILYEIEAEEASAKAADTQENKNAKRQWERALLSILLSASQDRPGAVESMIEKEGWSAQPLLKAAQRIWDRERANGHYFTHTPENDFLRLRRELLSASQKNDESYLRLLDALNQNLDRHRRDMDNLLRDQERWRHRHGDRHSGGPLRPRN